MELPTDFLSLRRGFVTQSWLRVLESLKRQNIILFLKGGREKVPTMRSTNKKLEQTILKRKNQEDSPRMKFGGIK